MRSRTEHVDRSCARAGTCLTVNRERGGARRFRTDCQRSVDRYPAEPIAERRRGRAVRGPREYRGLTVLYRGRRRRDDTVEALLRIRRSRVHRILRSRIHRILRVRWDGVLDNRRRCYRIKLGDCRNRVRVAAVTDACVDDWRRLYRYWRDNRRRNGDRHALTILECVACRHRRLETWEIRTEVCYRRRCGGHALAILERIGCRHRGLETWEVRTDVCYRRRCGGHALTVLQDVTCRHRGLNPRKVRTDIGLRRRDGRNWRLGRIDGDAVRVPALCIRGAHRRDRRRLNRSEEHTSEL